MTIGNRIKEVRTRLGLTQMQLAKNAGVKQSTIADLERGHTNRSPSITQIAMALGVNPDWLVTGKGAADRGSLGSNVSEHHATLGRVPLISWVAAGNWSENVDNFVAGYAETWVVATIPVKQHTYALLVEGDSMEPMFPNGATIIVEPEEDAHHGSYVIVRQNGGEATFKQLIIDGGQYYLKPLNPRYPIMQMRDDATICGVVKEIRMLV